jgi:hypothetical protein
MSSVIKKIKDHKELFLILLLAAALRIFAVRNVFIADEPWFYRIALDGTFSLHPPLFFLVQKLFVQEGVFWTARLMPFVFSLINISAVYFVARSLFNKRTAIFASLVMTLSFWHAYASSLIDMNNTLVMLEYTVAFYLFMRYLQKEETKFLILSGVMLGAVSLTKYADALVLAALLSLLYLYEKRSIKRAIPALGSLGIVAAVMYSLFPLFSYLFGYWPEFLSTIGHAKVQATAFTFRPFMILLLWATPLLWGLSILSLKKRTKYSVPLALWALTVFSIYFVIVRNSNLVYERYLVTMIPPLCMLAGSYLAQTAFKKRDMYMGLLSFVFSYAVILFLNLRENIFVPHVASEYLAAIKSLHLNFLFPYTGSSGPSFWVSFDSMMFGIGLSIVFLLCAIYFALKKRSLAITFSALFIGVALACNIFLIQEHNFSLTNPSVNVVANDVIHYYNTHDLPKKVFIPSFMNGIGQYLIDANTTKLNMNDIQRSLPLFLATNRSSVIVIDFPTLNRDWPVWEYIDRCEKVYISQDKGAEIGAVYVCEMNK